MSSIDDVTIYVNIYGKDFSEVFIKYSDNALTAISRNIELSLIKSLDSLGMPAANFGTYKITSKIAAEVAISKGSPKTWKAFFEDNVEKYGYVSAKEVSVDYLDLLNNQSPWHKGYNPTSRILQPGETIYFVVD